MLRLARSRVLPRCGASRAFAPHAYFLAAVDVTLFTCEHHVEGLRLFSSQTNNGDDKEKDDKFSLFSAAAWEEAVKPGYLTFFTLNKHLMVPVKFVVPSGDDAWPETAWGCALGKHAKWLRKQRREGGRKINPQQLKELEEMPFAWEKHQYTWDHFFLPALRRYYELNEHMDVPHEFRVPTGDPKWPERLWGHNLGRHVKDIRYRGAFVKQVKTDARRLGELDELGFVWNHIEAEWTERILPALKVFREVKGHCRVPDRFVVPADSSWPKRSWGLNLGWAVGGIRNGNYSAHISQDSSQLEALDFVWDIVEADWSERILPALEVYRKLHGDCRVPVAFVVPPDEKWPEKSWNLRLGNTVRTIRYSGSYSAQVSRDKSRLKTLGFVWNLFEAEWNRILSLLKVYFKENGHSRVQSAFVVPSEPAWPIEAHGLKLGKRVYYIRHRGGYFDYAARSVDTLQAIGFGLHIADAKWRDRVEPLLTTFEQLHGHRNVPRDFVVPSVAPWSEKDWGIQLGKLERKMPSQARYGFQGRTSK